jgi:hypothetical protein
VFGEGIPFFDGVAGMVDLEGPEVIEATGVTHLRYRVARQQDRENHRDAEAAVTEIAQPGRA